MKENNREKHETRENYLQNHTTHQNSQARQTGTAVKLTPTVESSVLHNTTANDH